MATTMNILSFRYIDFVLSTHETFLKQGPDLIDLRRLLEGTFFGIWTDLGFLVRLFQLCMA